MAVRFTDQDLTVFDIPDFAGRMTAIRGRILPKLKELGEELGPLLLRQFKREFFAHTAKHMRRKVNPPDETWVALGPQSRGYKAYVFFAFCIGKDGAQARVTMKDESAMRPALGDNLIANRKYFEKKAAEWRGIADYSRRDSEYLPGKISSLGKFLEESAGRLNTLKSALFDVGLAVKPTGANLAREAVQAFERLYPFYECGLQKGVKFR